MMQRRPDITDEEIGMRAFQLRKERAVERSLEKIRQSLGQDWVKLSIGDIDILNWVLGEVWAHIARKEWQDIAFSSLNLQGVQEIIEVGKEIINHTQIGSEGLDKVYKMLKKL